MKLLCKDLCHESHVSLTLPFIVAYSDVLLISINEHSPDISTPHIEDDPPISPDKSLRVEQRDNRNNLSPGWHQATT